MSHSIASIASILKIRLGSDREDLKLNDGTIQVHFMSFLIELFTHKQAAFFSEKLQKSAKNRVSTPMKNFTMQNVQLLVFMMCIFNLIDY